MKQTRGEKAFQWFNYLFLSVLCFTFLFPFWRIAALSLNEGLDASRGGINFWPRKFTFDNFAAVFSRSDIMNAYAISIGRTVIGTLLSIVLVSLMAYGLSKQRLKGRGIINVMLILTMFFSGGLIPTYMLYKSLHLLNTFWVYIVPTLYGAAAVFIFRSFFRAMPQELEDSAQLDGANDLTIFSRIAVPLSLPIFATMALFSAVGHWNDYLTAVIYTTDEHLLPLQTLLMKVMNINQNEAGNLAYGVVNLNESSRRTVTAESVKMAMLIVVVLPILTVYPFLQRYFVKGVIIGSLKG
ncbi:carbohydrate ABC transporter permease [Cohnella hashimotonis]|uniref:Carbohydrate ABC transporter permease n=1 Tax=Cohnella hashimotonis TaxID=2826895 RepID=A0ABT6TFJ3_9BACL|nr:carbohydrate ABC transporter permease [Cohnella hashimotonis]MDI4645600.1 carbohydrate ABC transporter permease [Cohnella hashimotonis]